MSILYKGAEAELERTEYLGISAVKKRRFPKRFIHPELDARIRYSRMRRECLMLSEARRAVHTPHVLSVDPVSCSFLMEFVQGQKVRDLFHENKGLELSEDIGRSIRRLHDLGIIHGDLTTSNMILMKRKIYFIDFGLAFKSQKDEDKATDLLVFKKTLSSTHPPVFKKVWQDVLRGYADKKVSEKIKDVESRARYV